MRAILCPVGLAVALTVGALAGPASAEGLAVTPGLWEMTSAGSGAPPPPLPQIPADQLAKMTPQQQQMLQQRLAAIAAGSGKPMTNRFCVTQAMLDKGYTGPENNRRCTRTIVTQSAAVLEFKLTCQGDRPTTGTVHIDATDAHTMTGVVDMALAQKDGTAFPIHRTMQGRWLGADCGDVKPPVQ
jgi:hypothetical protein